MKVFKNKWFTRWAKKNNVLDSTLFKAAKEIVEEKVEADLGGALFKKRLPRKGGGKSGGYRVIVGYKKPNSDRIVFLFAFSKNEKANLTAKEEAAFSVAAKCFISLSDQQILKLIEKKEVMEVKENE